MTRALSFAACALFVGPVLGCGASDRPEAAGDTATLLMNGGEPPSTSTAEDALNPVVAVGEPGIPRRDCEPLSYKECRVYYTDHNGIPQCPMSHQLCSTAGRWLPCGEYYFDANMVITKK